MCPDTLKNYCATIVQTCEILATRFDVFTLIFEVIWKAVVLFV